MEKIDFNNFDKLNLFVKKSKHQDVVKSYTALGWELIEEKENNRYEDIIDLTFLRPHKLQNKDELQIMQVYMEDNLNEIAKLERNKHSKTTGLGLFLGSVALLLFCWALYLIIKPQLLVIGIILIAVSIILFVLEIIFLPKLFKKEKLSFNTKFTQLNSQIEEICKKANLLLGGKDAQN